MSDITREALEGMGFEESGVNFNDYEIIMRAKKYAGIFVHLSREDESFGCVSLDNYDELLHIRTLPQLRQLIRTLFGDDALPRREFGSITETEFISALQAGITKQGIPNFTVRSQGRFKNNGDSISCYISDCDGFGYWYNLLFYKEASRFSLVYFPVIDGKANTEQPNTLPIATGMLSYLINELDIFVPAFHDNEQS